MGSCKGLRKNKQYEITLKDETGQDRFGSEYGFGTNPPIVVTAKSVSCAKKLLDPRRLRKDKVEIVSIKRA